MRLFIALAVAAIAVPQAASACAPPTLTRVVTRNVAPDLPAGHWASQPMVIHRLGAKNLRVEEPRDAAGKLHLMILVVGKDVWFVNKEDRTGRHMIDPDPEPAAHMPIVNDTGAPQMAELEYGCEADFVRAKGLPAEGERVVSGRSGRVHAFVVGDRRLELVMAGALPLAVTYRIGGEVKLDLVYDEHRSGLDEDAALFRLPAGYAISEAPEGPAS